MEWRGFCLVLTDLPRMAAQRPELCSPTWRLDPVMKNENGMFGVVVGCVVALVAFAFIVSGGELGGKKTIDGDQDLPPVESSNQ